MNPAWPRSDFCWLSWGILLVRIWELPADKFADYSAVEAAKFDVKEY